VNQKVETAYSTKIKLGILWVFALILLVPCLCFGDSQFQVWSNVDGVVELDKEWFFKVQNQFRFSDSEDFFQYHTDLGMTYAGLAEWFDFGVNFRFIRRKGVGSDWEEENRPHLNFIFRTQIFDLPVSNRIRLEYSDDDALGDFGTFRYRFMINPQFEERRDFLAPLLGQENGFFGSHDTRPFAAYELFSDTETNEISRHRLSAGLSVKFSDSLVGDLFYMFEDNESFRDGENLHVLRATLRILF
jgi:hypothetical protein